MVVVAGIHKLIRQVVGIHKIPYETIPHRVEKIEIPGFRIEIPSLLGTTPPGGPDMAKSSKIPKFSAAFGRKNFDVRNKLIMNQL